MTLIGVTSPAVASAIASAGGRLAGVETRAVEATELAALLFRPADPPWRWLRSRAALTSLLLAQRILEAAAAFGPLLPARPGTLIRDDAEAHALLCGRRRQLAESLHLHGNATQFQVTMTWSPIVAPAARRDDADLRTCAGDQCTSDAAGSMMDRSTSEERAAFKVEAMRALAAVVKDVIALPIDRADMLTNAVVLLAPGAEPDLERALQALDSRLSGKILIRLIGPLPPVSFAAISIDRPSRDRIAAARHILGVGAEAEPRELRRAYLAFARAHHPDTGRAAGAQTVGAAAEAFRLLVRIAEARRGADQEDVLLVDVLRQDEHRSGPP
jgi:hypothetical protein